MVGIHTYIHTEIRWQGKQGQQNTYFLKLMTDHPIKNDEPNIQFISALSLSPIGDIKRINIHKPPSNKRNMCLVSGKLIEETSLQMQRLGNGLCLVHLQEATSKGPTQANRASLYNHEEIAQKHWRTLEENHQYELRD